MRNRSVGIESSDSAIENRQVEDGDSARCIWKAGGSDHFETLSNTDDSAILYRTREGTSLAGGCPAVLDRGLIFFTNYLCSHSRSGQT